MCFLKSLSWVFMLASVATASAADPPVTSLAFSPCGETLVACSQTGVSLYDWPTLKLRRTVETTSSNLHDAAFSPNGSVLAIAGGTPSENGTVNLFSWPKCEQQSVLRGHSDSVMSVVWMNDTKLVTASLDHQVAIWDTATGKPLHRLNGHSRGVRTLAVLRPEQQFVSAGIDHALRLWEAQPGTLVHGLSLHTGTVTKLSSRPGIYPVPVIASASEDRTVRFWQPTIGRMVRFVRLPSVPLDIDWFPDRIANRCGLR